MTILKSKITRRQALTAGAALAASPALIGFAAADETVTWRVQALWPKASSSFTDGLQVIVDTLKDATGGRFNLELYGSGEFASGGDIFQIVKNGVVEMGTISPGYTLDQAPTGGLITGLPGAFKNTWELQYYIKNSGVEALYNEELAYHGIVSRAGMVYPTELVVSKEINTLEDFQSLKLRSGGTYLQLLEAAGASAQNIGGSELYQALSTGVVDGAHWGGAQGAKSMSLWEVAKYHMQPPLGLSADAIIINQSALDALPEDLRDTLMDVLETRFWQRCSEYQYLEKQALARGVAENNVVVKQFPQVVLDKFASASKDMIENERAKGGNATKAADRLVDLQKVLGYA